MDPYQKSLTIQEVSQRLKVPKHTLRFWEKELDGILVPDRTEGGQRRYGSEHIFIIEEVIRLRRKGFHLADIKRSLKGIVQNVKTELHTHHSNNLDELADEIAEVVKSTVRKFFQEYSPE